MDLTPDLAIDFSQDGAVVSECNTYQYAKWSPLEGDKGLCLILGLEPSMAEGRSFEMCREFAQRGGYSTLAFVFMFAESSDHPKVPFGAIGPDTDQWIRVFADRSAIIIGAWGDFPRIGPRVRAVLKSVSHHDIYSIQTNRNGTPTHPAAWKRKAAKIYRARAVGEEVKSAS